MTFTLLLAASVSASDWLTSLDSVRELQQKQTGVTTGQDPLVESQIARFTAWIQNQLGREFLPFTGDRSFPWRGGSRVEVGDVRSVTAVSLDSDGVSPVTVADGGWRLRPANPDHGVYRSLYLPDYARSRVWGDQVVSVSGEWGFDTVPDDVEGVCAQMVVDSLRGDVAFSEVGEVQRLGDGSSKLSRLDHYRLPSV